MRSSFLALLLLTGASALPLRAEPVTLAPVRITDWKAVYGTVEPRDRAPARARIGGIVTELLVTEGDMVTEGQPLARIVDEKLAFQLSALEAQRASTAAQLENAKSELARGEQLLKDGVTTAQRLDGLRTQVDVLNGQIGALDAQAEVIKQTQGEGAVIAPAAGRVLDVPVTKGSVVMPGEQVALLSGGGVFLRLAVPERLAQSLHAGDAIQIEGQIEGGSGQAEGKLAKIYPLIENGRVLADVEVSGLADNFIDARVLVRLPVGSHDGLVVPETALVTRSGLDFVATEAPGGAAFVPVVPGTRQVIDGAPMVEILSGLAAGDRVLPEPPAAPQPAAEATP